ncbi:MAG: Holliday junction resolvase RuvX [Gammaproteobacteria bacterium]|nr:Holliday junction resolvase RuvX [Gammaproteobacteria bacterium]
MALDSFPAKHTDILSVLAFDYGTRRIGVAYGQSLTGTATALPILKARDGIPHWPELATLINTWQPGALVVGLPYNMDGSDSELLARAIKFANRLNGRFHLPCYGIDERLSSVAAEELVGKRNSDPVDSVAAQLILQSWFAELENR